MSNCAIVGINWGDEGKGRMVDLLTEKYDVVVRYQGGGNAGHTVINEYGKFALHLIPSGIFRKGVVNILGDGVALDPENLWLEIESIREKGVHITPENLKISNRASLLMPWHRELDALEEQRLADKKYGSTKQGIAPFYSDKYAKKTVMAGELFYPDQLKNHLADLLEWKNLTLVNVYGAKPYTMEMLDMWIKDYCEKIKPFICDTAKFMKDALKKDKKIMFEAQLGSLRDLNCGIYPYTTSSNTTAAFAPVGAGAPGVKIDDIIGVVKAYSTCVGEGPFISELHGDEASDLREAGEEYGAKTGRPRAWPVNRRNGQTALRPETKHFCLPSGQTGRLPAGILFEIRTAAEGEESGHSGSCRVWYICACGFGEYRAENCGNGRLSQHLAGRYAANCK